MAEITPHQISAALEIGTEWLSEKLTRSEAVRLLAKDYDLNAVSAGDLLQVLRAMRSGERFTRSISAPAAEIYLEGIFSTAGQQGVDAAIYAIDQHIEYYESIRPVTLHKLRAVRDSWKATQSANLPPIDAVIAALDERVESMLNASPSERVKHLPKRGQKPKVSYARVKVFSRNAAVVAEVLVRADGKCESCGKAAPFQKAKDGRPYLEVHHIEQLAHGGEDSVENATAVCPNCHRYHHFG